MFKKVFLLLMVLVSSNCAYGYFPVDNAGYVTRGQYIHMEGLDKNPVQIIEYVYDHEGDVEESVEWINGRLGSDVLRYNDTHVPLGGSAIVLIERPLGEGILGLSVIEEVKADGGVPVCVILMNDMMKDYEETRRTVLKHEILHCLGLSDDMVEVKTKRGETSIMTGMYDGNDVEMTKGDIEYLRNLYGLEK